MLVPVRSERGNEVTIPNSPIRLSRTPAAIRGGPPTTGRDTRDVLGRVLKMNEAEIDAAFASGAAALPEELPEELTR
jgi:crotonobetainyl-CoA:carnitine CoA-transferase CaiB-like acyl-CoA transferase